MTLGKHFCLLSEPRALTRKARIQPLFARMRELSRKLPRCRLRKRRKNTYCTETVRSGRTWFRFPRTTGRTPWSPLPTRRNVRSLYSPQHWSDTCMHAYIFWPLAFPAPLRLCSPCGVVSNPSLDKVCSSSRGTGPIHFASFLF